MVFLIVGTLAAGLFAGAAIYVNAVEHPARISCGTELAVREFAPSYTRGATMQASLALIGCVMGVIGGWQHGSSRWIVQTRQVASSSRIAPGHGARATSSAKPAQILQ